MRKDLEEYYFPYKGKLFDKLYEQYEAKLQIGDHLGTHQKFITDLYNSVYGKEIIGSHIDAILFLFYAISNSCDDIIDNSPVEHRKNFATDVIRVYISFFIFFERIICSIDLFDEMKEIFEAMRTELPDLIEAPYKELDPPKEQSNVPSTIIEIENNRCIDHKFICKVLDGIVQRNLRISKVVDREKNSHILILHDLYKIVVLFKGFEFITKDLVKNELVKDINSHNFNILTYLYNLGITQQEDLVRILNKTKKLILLKSNELNQSLALSKTTLEIIQSSYEELEKQFEDQMKEFDQLFQQLLSLMMKA